MPLRIRPDETLRRLGSLLTRPPAQAKGRSRVRVARAACTPATAYHFRILARNGSGRSTGSISSSRPRLPQAPTALTIAASSITSFSATLNATRRPQRRQGPLCRFEYGTSDLLRTQRAVPARGRSRREPGGGVARRSSGLSEYTEYHFRIVARNATGSSYGGDLTFTTTSRGSLVQLGPKTATEGGEIALSADGGTLLVGSPGDEGGAVRVYVRSGPGWRLQARLGGNRGGRFELRGARWPSPSDGNTALVGAPDTGSY